MTTIDIHTLAGAYALDAVSDIERAAFDRHLAACPSCAQELAEFRATLARLADLTPAAPPARMKTAVLAAAARTPQVRPVRPVERARSKGWRGWAAGVAAAAVIAVGGGAVGYAISDRNTRTAQAQIAATEQRDAQIAAVMSAPDASVHVQAVAGGGTVSVIVSESLNQGVAVAMDMPTVSTGKAYQLWLISGDRAPVSAGVMDPGQTTGTVVLGNVRGATNFGVSLESAGGAAQPTQPLVTSFAI